VVHLCENCCNISSCEFANLPEPLLFIEHVAAQCGTWTRRIQDGIEPVWKTMFDNCHPNRETGKNLENLGFESVDYQQFNLSFPIVSPHIAGVARKKNVEIVEQNSKSLINTQNV
jgi:hypothetical protein